ncbi:MAG: hypothetical protein OK438_00830 [Thaumarchaeota archaeon]|nr:hypothetical protein [Nitrososphaerota archaeon]
MDTSHTVRLYSVAQYQLSLDYGAETSMLSVTSPSIPGDGYWYDSGTTVSFAGEVGVVGFQVTGWALDGSGTNSVSSATTFSSTPFAMTKPRSLTIVLTPASGPSCGLSSCTSAPVFDMTVKTDKNVAGGVWVDGTSFPQTVTFSWPAGSIHNITAIQSDIDSSVREYFSHWSGDSTSRSPTITLIVNKTGYLAPEYHSQYLVSLAFTDAGGSPLTPQAVTLDGPAGVQKLGPNLSMWAIEGDNYKLTSVSWSGSNVVMDNASVFSVNFPQTIAFPLAVYPQVVRATDVYGLRLQGAMVNVTTSTGVGFSMKTDAQGIVRFRVPFGIYAATVSYLGVTEQIVPNSLGSHTFTVSFLLSYPLFATVGAATAIACVFVFVRLRRRPDFQGIYYFDSE